MFLLTLITLTEKPTSGNMFCILHKVYNVHLDDLALLTEERRIKSNKNTIHVSR